MGKALQIVAVCWLMFVGSALGQSAQLSISILDSDTTASGAVVVSIEAKVTNISPSTLGSATIDLDYDSDLLTFNGVIDSDINPGTEGYSYSANGLNGDPVQGNGSGDYVRLTIAGANVGAGFGKAAGFDVPSNYVNLGTLEFTITENGATASDLSLFVRTGSLSIGFFENQSNDPETGVIVEATVDEIVDANNFVLPVEEFALGLDEDYLFGNPFPNPFNSLARFTFAVREPQDVRIEVYNMVGQRVAVVLDGAVSGNELMRLSFDGARLANGVYHVRATGKTFSDVRSVVLVK